MKLLDKKATWVHYASTFFIILGIWYVYSTYTHGGNYQSPLADTSVDITSMVILGG